MVRARSLTLLSAMLVLASAGVFACFEKPKPACAFLCGAQAACPTDYRCGTDNRCHLLVNGSPQACDDNLPADASLVDGPRVDAAAPDAMVDATVNMAPTLSTNPVGPTVNAVAGSAVSITASATDPDADTLTFSAAYSGSGKDPFTLSAATFSTSTHIFAMTAGVLGDHGVTFTVNDGHGHIVNKNMTIHVTANPVELNEVQQGATAANENIELINTSGAVVTITGWRICDGGTASCYTFPTATIAANGFVVLHWWQAGTDTTTDFFDVALPPATLGDLVLYGPGAGTTANDILDYVRSGTAAGTASTQSNNAVTAGQWPTGTSFVDNTGTVDGNSIARTAGANTEAPADWALDTTPTIGAANN